VKITGINIVNESDVPRNALRATQTGENVRRILEQFARLAPGKALILSGTEIRKYERYALQKALQKQGAHVLVGKCQDANGKDALSIRKLSEADWKEYIKSH